MSILTSIATENIHASIMHKFKIIIQEIAVSCQIEAANHENNTESTNACETTLSTWVKSIESAEITYTTKPIARIAMETIHCD